MPPVSRTCSECGSSLSGRSVQTRTCGDLCRSARSRRIRRQRREQAAFETQAPLTQAVQQVVVNESLDVVTRVMREELRPVVREALTEEVLQAVQDMLGLTPTAVLRLQEDLEAEDSTVRQRAYTLILKYTIGHPALLQAKDTQDTGQMVVNFNLPRPDELGPEDIDLEPQPEFDICDICGTEKPADEFAAGSQRCISCFEEHKARVLEAFA